MLALIPTIFFIDSDAIKGLADNVRRLMEIDGLSQQKLAKRAGLAQRTVSDLLSYGRTSSKSPTLSTIEKIAASFDVPTWLIQVPHLPDDLLRSHRLSRLVENYVEAPERGRENVDRIAESEMHYHVVVESGKKSA